jgi:deoxyribonuclease-4
MRRFGLHTSISGGLHFALERGSALGCDTVQIFSHNPRGWHTKPISDEEAKHFREARKRLGIDPVFVHTSYLLNVASPDPSLRKRSLDMLSEEMRRADTIGADYVVLHTGTAHDGMGMERAAKSIIEALEAAGAAAGLLLENTSGKRGDISSKVEDLARLLELTRGLAAGVCIDSCHAFAAGYDLSADEGIGLLGEEVERLIGAEGVRLLHLNDSKSECGSGTDRHEHIGEGRIGSNGLKAFLSINAFAETPAILETPREDDSDDIENLSRARSLEEKKLTRKTKKRHHR